MQISLDPRIETQDVKMVGELEEDEQAVTCDFDGKPEQDIEESNKEPQEETDKENEFRLTH